jgi:hypothetical protein
MKRNRSSKPAKRRTTLTLPADTLAHAERIAQERKVTLSSVVAQALEEGLRTHAYAERSEELLKAFQRPFAGLSDEEMMILDGIIVEPVPVRRRA